MLGLVLLFEMEGIFYEFNVFESWVYMWLNGVVESLFFLMVNKWKWLKFIIFLDMKWNFLVDS